jgi:GNAT superfamily N-acetyltransferase
MTTFTVEELVIPSSVFDDDAADFVESVGVRNAVETAGYGTGDLAYTPAEVLPGWLDTEHAPRRLFGVRVDGALVSRGMYESGTADDAKVGWAIVEVLPAFRGRGIGTAVAERIEQIARLDRRDRLLVYVVSPDGPGERLAPPTGFGSLPAENPEVRFLLGRGYRLEQIERASRLALPVDEHDLRGLVAAASIASGLDYVVHSWIDRTPENWAEDVAAMYTRMSTDAPTAGLEEPEDPWSTDRLAAHEDRNESDPRSMLTVAVEHAPTGRLVGYSQLSVPPESDRAVIQDDTLVLREHRGHRLGMLLKVANLAALQHKRPGHPSIITFNAEENRHMLRVNEELGFVPIGYEGAWRKDFR